MKVAIPVKKRVTNIPMARPECCKAHGIAKTDVPIIVFHMAILKIGVIVRQGMIYEYYRVSPYLSNGLLHQSGGRHNQKNKFWSKKDWPPR